jgi:hypothetical protein
MTRDELLRLLILATRETYRSQLAGPPGGPRPVGDAIGNPRPGDLVYENSTCRTSSVGRLVLVRTEFVPPDPDPEDSADGDTFWYVEGLDGGLQRWWNCEFRRILEDASWALREGDPPRTEWVAEALKRHGLEG